MRIPTSRERQAMTAYADAYRRLKHYWGDKIDQAKAGDTVVITVTGDMSPSFVATFTGMEGEAKPIADAYFAVAEWLEQTEFVIHPDGPKPQNLVKWRHEDPTVNASIIRTRKRFREDGSFMTIEEAADIELFLWPQVPNRAERRASKSISAKRR